MLEIIVEPKGPSDGYRSLSLPGLGTTVALAPEAIQDHYPLAQDASGRLVIDCVPGDFSHIALRLRAWPDMQPRGPTLWSLVSGRSPWAALSADGTRVVYERPTGALTLADPRSGRAIGTFRFPGADLGYKIDKVRGRPVGGDCIWATYEGLRRQGGEFFTGYLVRCDPRPSVLFRQDGLAGVDGGGQGCVGRDGVIAVRLDDLVASSASSAARGRQEIVLLRPGPSGVARKSIVYPPARKGEGNVYDIALAGPALLVARDFSGDRDRPGAMPVTRIEGIDVGTGARLWEASFHRIFMFLNVDPGNGLSLWWSYTNRFSYHWADLWCVAVHRDTMGVAGTSPHGWTLWR